MTTLPKFDLFQKQTMPNRRRVLCFTKIEGCFVEIASNWPGTRFWLYSRKNGFRMSSTLSTASQAKGRKWLNDVKEGQIKFADDEKEGV